MNQPASVPERIATGTWVLITALWSAFALFLILSHHGSAAASTWTVRLILLAIASAVTTAVVLVVRAAWRRALRTPLAGGRWSTWLARRRWWQLALFYCGQKLIGRTVQAAGVTRPDDLPLLAPGDDFPRNADGFAGLLAAAGLAEPSCQIVGWEHRVAAEDWWSGAAAGVSFFGHLIVRQAPEKIAEIQRHFDEFSSEFAGSDGMLALPHVALAATGRA
jgi:hypothetical protein